MIVFFYTTSTEKLKEFPEVDKFVWLDKSYNITPVIEYICKKMTVSQIYLDRELQFNSKKFSVREITLQNEVTEHSGNIAFFPSSDTLSRSFLPIVKGLPCSKIYIPFSKDEGAKKVFDGLDVPSSRSYIGKMIFNRPSLIVLANDWGTEELFIIKFARFLKIKTICLQESVVDFGEKPSNRMKWADIVFVQGINTIAELDRKNYFVTGNSRYENLSIQPVPETPSVLINCNFTYGIFEDWREKWLSAITSSCVEKQINYFISQHPRDRGDLSSYKNVLSSNAGKVEDQLKSASIVITRFSSLIHEALCMGRRVIYFNPHGETMRYDFGFDEKNLFLATTIEELKNALEKCFLPMDNRSLENYLKIHCLSVTRKPSEIISALLKMKNLPCGQDALEPPFRIYKATFIKYLKYKFS